MGASAVKYGNNKQSTEMESYIAAWRRNSSMYMSVHVSIQVCRLKLKKICLIEMAKKLYTFCLLSVSGQHKYIQTQLYATKLMLSKQEYTLYTHEECLAYLRVYVNVHGNPHTYMYACMYTIKYL